MLQRRYMKAKDNAFGYTLGRHLFESEFDFKVRDPRGYVLLKDNMPVALLR